MRILYIGDIFGEEALKYLENNLKSIVKDNKINLVLANAENVTKGKGLSKEHYTRLMKMGIRALSMGNHTYAKSEIKDYIEDANIVRPANFHEAPGKKYFTFNYNDKKITLVNMLGRVYMGNMCLDCPFQTMDSLLDNIESDYIIVDMHAEATSEKIAFAYNFDGKVSAVLGTHTHVQTADARKLPKGTLYITDIGMTGPANGVIGDDAIQIIDRFKTGMYTPANVSKGSIELNAVILDFNPFGNTITPLNIKF